MVFPHYPIFPMVDFSVFLANPVATFFVLWHSLQQIHTAAAWGSKRHRERRRRDVSTSGTAVRIAQMGINFHQSSGTVPL